MGAALDRVAPSFAPVPQEILLHILANRRRDTLLSKSKRSPRSVSFVPGNSLEKETGFSQEEWDELLKDVRTVRQAVFEEMDGAIRREGLTTAWLSAKLAEAAPRQNVSDQDRQKKIPRSTLGGWQKRGLVEFSGRNTPNPDLSAAILIARHLDKRRFRHWLPSHMALAVNELIGAELQGRTDQISSFFQPTRFVCWKQDPPPFQGAFLPPPVPCSFPPPPEFSKATILASPWQGLLWRPYWRRVSNIGVGRWYGVNEQGWDLSLDDLVRWMGSVSRFAIPHMEKSAPDVFQEFADVVLVRLSYDILTCV